MQQNSKCRLAREKDKPFNHLISDCSDPLRTVQEINYMHHMHNLESALKM